MILLHGVGNFKRKSHPHRLGQFIGEKIEKKVVPLIPAEKSHFFPLIPSEKSEVFKTNYSGGSARPKCTDQIFLDFMGFYRAVTAPTKSRISQTEWITLTWEIMDPSLKSSNET